MPLKSMLLWFSPLFKMIHGAREHFTVAGLTILGKYRKRQRLVEVVEAMKRLKALRETDQRLRELFEEENYIGAIVMCAECQRAASSFRHYRCISDLADKLHDTMTVIEQQLDNALASMTLCVDLERYSRVVAAYEMIGKTKAAVDSLIDHFSKTLNNSVESILEAYYGSGDGTNLVDGSPPGAAKPALHAVVPAERLLECFREILSVFWRIWLGYHTIFLWHVERPFLTPQEGPEDHANGDDYVATRLEQGLSSLWFESLSHLSGIIQNVDLNSLKTDECLALIDLTNKICRIGERHFKSRSAELEESLREKSIEYFKYHHHQSLDEVAMFLEAEAWEMVPVKRQFIYKDLPEFSFLVNSSNPSDQYPNGSIDDTSLNNWEFMNENNSSINPFELHTGSKENELHVKPIEQTESDDSDVPEELKQDYIDETVYENEGRRPALKKHSSFKSADSMQPILSNVALTMLRLWGRSIQAAHSLPSISFEVVVMLAQLFDYYFLAIYRYFGTDAVDYDVEYRSAKLVYALQRIEQALPEIGKDVPPNRLGSLLTCADGLFGLAPRIVAVESLIFVAKQLDGLRPLLQRLVPPMKVAFISQFYSQTVAVIPELRRVVYGAVASKSLNYDRFYNAVLSVNWEIHELMSQHSEYVDILVQDLGTQRSRISELSQSVQVPKEAYVMIWECSIQIIAKLLVEGYSSARRCSNEGRALMQLDFQQLLLVMEKISNLRPLPHREYVESYIKAYYLPETKLESWVKERKEYSPKQLTGLLNVATHISTKMRQRLITSLSGNLDDS